MAVVAEAAAGTSPRARPRPIWTVNRLRVAGAIVLLGLWEMSGASGLFFRGVLPSTWLIAQAGWELLSSAEFYRHLWVTGYEVLASFAIGCLSGTLVGLVLGTNKYTGAVFEPFIHYLAPTPKIVFLPILLVLFGVGPPSKIALGSISAFFPMALGVAAGVRQVSPVLLRVGMTFSLTTWQTVRMIYIPALVPPLASGLRIGLGIAIVGCLLSEYKLAKEGLGFLAGNFYDDFRVPHMLAVLIIIFALASLGNSLIERLVRLPGPETRKARPAA
jgi:ABC-type nitrate/sulfonate/bicarbonate transport system permease component